MNVQINRAELMKQHEAAKARQARLSGNWPPMPTVSIIRRPAEPAPEKPVEVARDWLRVKGEMYVSVSTIIEVVCRHFKITVAELKGPSRRAGNVRARQIVMYLARKMTLRSLPDIGRRLGGKDHTTILHGVRKIEALIEVDAELAAQIDDLRRRLEGLS